MTFFYRDLQNQNKLKYDDTSFIFIRNALQIIETKYPVTNTTLEISSSSCRVAGNLFCTYLLKMLFAIYNTEPLLKNNNLNNNESYSSKTI